MADATALIEAIGKRLETEGDGLENFKAGLREVRAGLQAWSERGGTQAEYLALERRALDIFNDFDRARFFGTHRILRTDLPAPERTEELVAYSEANRQSGERALFGLVKGEEREEAWLYVQYAERGRVRHAWYEIGRDETRETATTLLSDMTAIISEIGPERIRSVSHYHIHPSGIERRATVSNKDLSSFVFLSENVLRRFPALAAKLDMRVVNEEGIYSLHGYDLRRFQDFIGRVSGSEDDMVRWFSIPFKTGADFVQACRSIGIDASFTARETRRAALR